NLAVARPGGLGGANRSFDSLAAVAPTANNDTYGVSISGSQSPENSYLIDGLSLNATAEGVNGSPLTLEFTDEVNVITAGYMPEYGRTLGGAVTRMPASSSGRDSIRTSRSAVCPSRGSSSCPTPIQPRSRESVSSRSRSPP